MFWEDILSLGDWSLRAYRESSEIVYCTYSDLSVLEFMFLLYLCIYSFGFGASGPRNYTVDLY